MARVSPSAIRSASPAPASPPRCSANCAVVEPATAWRPCATAAGKASPQSSNAEDRKSVVEGKIVSVRVDLGGRGTIKKKNYKQIQQAKLKKFSSKNTLQKRN